MPIDVEIDSKSYQSCLEYLDICATQRKDKRVAFNKGSGDAILVGKLGECAFGIWAGLEVDFNFNARGDDADFAIELGTVDVKTAKSDKYGRNFIRVAQNYSGGWRAYPLTADFYVAAYLKKHGEKVAIVSLLGYQTKKALEATSPVVSPVWRDTKNVEMVWEDLLPIENLVT